MKNSSQAGCFVCIVFLFGDYKKSEDVFLSKLHLRFTL